MSEHVDYYIAALLDGINKALPDDLDVDKNYTLSIENITDLYFSGYGAVVQVDELLDLAIMKIESSDFIEILRDKYGGDIVVISDVDRFYDSFRGSDVFEKFLLLDNGYEWLSKALKNVNLEFQNQKDGAGFNIDIDDEWWPLPINREDPVYKEALKAVENAMRVIESDNGYSANEPDERDAIVTSLQGGTEALKNGSPTVKYLKDTLVNGFSYLTKKFADSAIGVAAKKALEALLPFIGL